MNPAVSSRGMKFTADLSDLGFKEENEYVKWPELCLVLKLYYNTMSSKEF